ncbi:hypothetical protein F2P81_002186 [Scophthalmus maximus]|uniref:Uncharacterized protein n=1 Tax=Scophthalmus maximus TaxID=52904 RepID=A0A6A4TG66_SCOMX|nr:hypothetical protein F2P81_002186 [Scophthalmus maximus]
MRDSAAPAVAVHRPALEDVSEEEDAFAADGQAPGGVRLSVAQMEAEFVRLTLRKQVSYSLRRPTDGATDDPHRHALMHWLDLLRVSEGENDELLASSQKVA